MISESRDTALLVMDLQNGIVSRFTDKQEVLSDACLDADPEVHRVLMEKVIPRQADVMTAGAWIESLNRPQP